MIEVCIGLSLTIFHGPSKRHQSDIRRIAADLCGKHTPERLDGREARHSIDADDFGAIDSFDLQGAVGIVGP
jgi:hypothetical protein